MRLGMQFWLVPLSDLGRKGQPVCTRLGVLQKADTSRVQIERARFVLSHQSNLSTSIKEVNSWGQTCRLLGGLIGGAVVLELLSGAMIFRVANFILSGVIDESGQFKGCGWIKATTLFIYYSRFTCLIGLEELISGQFLLQFLLQLLLQLLLQFLDCFKPMFSSCCQSIIFSMHMSRDRYVGTVR